MKVYVTRDSVAASDDVLAPHPVTFTITEEWDVNELVNKTLKAAKLPKVYGGEATWAVSSNIPIAVFAQQWRELRLLSTFPIKADRLDQTDDEIRLHWSYFAQVDPEVVYEVLRRLQLQAIK